MCKKNSVLAGVAAVAVVGMIIISADEAQARGRRRCCNSYGYSNSNSPACCNGYSNGGTIYGTPQTTTSNYAPDMSNAAPPPVGYDGAQAYGGGAGYQQGGQGYYGSDGRYYNGTQVYGPNGSVRANVNGRGTNNVVNA